MVYKFFDKKASATCANKFVGRAIKNKIMSRKELEELHKSIIRKFEKRKVHSSLIDNIWGAIIKQI